MKKLSLLFTIIICVACCITILPVEAEAANVVDSGECGANLTWVLDDSGTLTISGTGTMTFSEYPNPWYDKRAMILSIVIEDGVTEIGAAAFWGCMRLERILIPNTVVAIRGSAFEGCSSLSQITIPDSVTYLGSHAFKECSSLRNVVVPNNITSIEEHVFYSCKKLESISIPQGVTSIGDYAFAHCYQLTSLIIPDGVASIGEGAFNGCTRLSSITLPEKLTNIESGTFWNCYGLKSVTIPKGVLVIGASAFNSCTSLSNLIISDGVAVIEHNAFSNCKKLTCITIPTSVAIIDTSAFTDCNVWHVLYKGTEAQWNNLSKHILLHATKHYNSTGTEVIDLTNRICSICLANCTHKWDGGTVTKQASCSAAGEKTFTCTLCRQTKAETVAKLAHSYTNGCDASCNVCSESRSVSHTYDTKWSSDATNHWHACTSCGEKKDAAKHTPGAAATETKAQTCTTCGYVLKAALGHTHAYGSDWKSDTTNHWHVCACGAKTDEATHTWDSGKTNADGSKLFTCTVCKATKTEAAPSGGTTDGNTSGSGSSGNSGTSGSGSGSSDSSGTPGTGSGSSGSGDTPGTGGSSDGSGSSDVPNDTPADDNGKEDGGNSTVIVIVAAVVVLGGGGAAAWYVLSKKKK